MRKEKELVCRFFITTPDGAVPLEEATQEQMDKLREKILQAIGKVKYGE